MKNLFVLSLFFLASTFSCNAQHSAAASIPPQEIPPETATTKTLEETTTTTDSPLQNTPEQVSPPEQTEQYGTIRGKVIYEGGPTHKAMNVIKDEKTCGADDVMDESLMADANGGLKWAVVSISSEIKNGKSLDQLPTGKELDQSTCVYKPHVMLIGVNQEMTIKNMDHTLHNVRTKSFMNDVVNKVQIYMPNMPAPADKVTFTEPEVVNVVCDVHGWMNAYIHVVDHPYYSVSQDDGSFELTDVPPGKYTLNVWHEKLGEMQQTVEVKAGETSKIQFSYKKLQ